MYTKEVYFLIDINLATLRVMKQGQPLGTNQLQDAHQECANSIPAERMQGAKETSREQVLANMVVP
jgi:hypothetical protein